LEGDLRLPGYTTGQEPDSGEFSSGSEGSLVRGHHGGHTQDTTTAEGQNVRKLSKFLVLGKNELFLE
jgi:hypothetical protein